MAEALMGNLVLRREKEKAGIFPGLFWVLG